MKLTKLKLVTIIAEPVIATQIKTEVQSIGSTGVTTTEVQGEGSRHLKSGEIPGNKVKIECVVAQEVADQILKHITEKYFRNFSIIFYCTDIEVARSEKFNSKKM